MPLSLPSITARTVQPVLACSGMAWWKRKRIRDFLQTSHPIRFFTSSRAALRHARKKGGAVAIWANRVTPALQRKAVRNATPLFLVEDGFIRSIGLGSGLLPPCSIILDGQGAYVDPSHPSDLETLLANAEVSSSLEERASKLIATLHKLHISKYAASQSEENTLSLPRDCRVILVPGQVAGDLSVIRGAGTITDNLSLLKEVRRRHPEAWIIYRPHPDVEAGHRRGGLDDATTLVHANIIHRGGSISSLLDQVDEIHTLTSLTGFEALLRNKAVTTYGAPFYAGWGLTTHLGPPLPRRERILDITALAAITLILYPLYINPETGQRCEIEDLISCFGQAELWQPTLAMRLRQKQGLFRRFCSRLLATFRIPHA